MRTPRKAEGVDQLCHAIGLNDVCDWLRLKAAALSRFGVMGQHRPAMSAIYQPI